MFRAKKDIDKHVVDLFSKVKSENERNLRGFSIARLYFQVKDYEMAKRYLSGFINLRQDHAPAHKMMAEIFEVQGDPQQALHSYKRALELDQNLKDIVLKICELYCQIPVDPDTARYWADRGEKLFQHHRIIFKLRECIVSAEGEPNRNELESLISSELACRPNDASLHTKRLKLYMDTERIEAAFQYSLKMEERSPFLHNIDWYYCLSDICEAYQEEMGGNLDLEFCVHYSIVLDHLVTLLLAEPHLNRWPFQEEDIHRRGKSVADAAAILHTLDEFLLKSSCLDICREGPWKYVHRYMHGQLYLHLSTLLMKRARKDQGNWKEACRYGGALLLLAYSLKAGNLNLEMWFNKLENKKIYQALQRRAHLRLGYAGHILMLLCKEDKSNWTRKVKQETCVPLVREKIFQRAFSMLAPKRSNIQSFFLKDRAFLETDLEFPTSGSLQEHDKIAYRAYPESLHHLVWLSLHWKLESKEKYQPKFQVFDKLQHSSEVLTSGSPESLCQLDLEAFLVATVHCAWDALEQRINLRPSTESTLSVHPDICDPLCTETQATWWKAAYLLYTNSVKEKLGEFRKSLRKGLEVIRGVGNHGMDVPLLVHLSRHFADQCTTLRKRLGENEISEELVSLEDRGVHYWTLTLDLLERSAGRQIPKERWFGAKRGEEPSSHEVACLREEGRYYLACHKMNAGLKEQAIQDFSKLSSEYASYNSAQLLKKLIEEENKSEKRVALMERMKSCLYLTMDRISNNRNHPLNLTLHEELELLEMRFAEEQQDNSAELLDRVDDLVSMNGSPLRRRLNLSNGSVQELFSTPKQSPSLLLNDSMHVRPSPERLDAQFRALTLNQNKFFQECMEQQKSLIDSNRLILQELLDHKRMMEDFKKQLEVVQNLKCSNCSKARSSKTEEEEDDDEEAFGDNLYDYSLETEGAGGYPPYGGYPMLGGTAQRGTGGGGGGGGAYNYHPMMLHYPPPQYPPGMDPRPPRGCFPSYGTGLPFSEGQQLPQFNFRMSTPQSGPPGGVVPEKALPSRLGFGPWNNKQGGIAPHAFQIALPPSSANEEAPPPSQESESSGSILKSLIAGTPPLKVIPPGFFASPTEDTSTEPPGKEASPGSDSEEGEYEVTGDYAPHSPILAEVELTTGEEGEEVWFEERAKLFRFVEKEWKERGVGVVKLLHCQQKMKTRLLMRRDQVLKICANHYINSSMQLEHMMDNEKTWTWQAPDFADETIKPEHLCIRFKTGEIADAFKVAFERAAKLNSGVALPPPSTQGFGDKFKKPVGSWTCDTCYVNNSAEKLKCLACETLRAGIAAEKGSEPGPVGNTLSKMAGSFGGMSLSKNSTSFGGLDLTTKPKCVSCIGKDCPTCNPPAFKFGLPSDRSSVGFKFGMPDGKSVLGGFTFTGTPVIQSAAPPVGESIKDSTKTTEPKVASPFLGFQFSSPPKNEASGGSFFGTPKTSLIALGEKKSLFSGPERTPESSKEEEFEPSTQFVPVVPLPELVDVKTGEEEEEKLFGARAKLFRYDSSSKEWKERGIGEMKILKKDARARILMRREQVLKICANHYILPEMKLDTFNGNDRAWKWFAQDYSEGELRQEALAIKFKSAEVAREFEKAFNTSLKEGMKCSDLLKEIAVPPAFDYSSLPSFARPDAGSWECSDCYTRNQSSSRNCLACQGDRPASPWKCHSCKTDNLRYSCSKCSKPKTSPKKETFGRGPWNCPTCDGANEADSEICIVCSSSDGTLNSKVPSLTGDQWECSACYTTNSFKTDTCLECKAPLPPKLEPSRKAYLNKASKFTLAEPKFSVPISCEKSFGQNKPVFGNKDSSGTFGSGLNFSFGSSLITAIKTPSSSREFRFGSPQKFEFNFSGVRPKSPSKTPKSPGTPNDSYEDEADVSSDTDNIFFQPVIPLPPKVDLKTGEEEEETLYCQRAKLYRFDKDSGEWKERGTGDLKILCADGKARFLMRREQVLKVCLNHRLVANLEMVEKNEKTLMWACVDFSENEAREEKFAIRFKNKEIAQEFKSKLEEVKSKLSSTTPPKEERVAKAASSFSFRLNQESPKGFGLAAHLGVTPILPVAGGSIRDNKFSFSDVNVVSEKKAGSRQVEEAEKLGLPSNFYLYENKTPCKGCRGCHSCQSDVEIVFEKTASEDQVSRARDLLLPPNFYLYEDREPCPGCRGCKDDISYAKEAVPGGVEKNPLATFSFAPKDDSTFDSLASSAFSFETLASKTNSDSETTFKTSPSYVFKGAGMPLFGGSSNSSALTGGEEEVVQGADVHFEPVVPLPELIEVKTGEEDETAIFNERAKLYRFDSSCSQWKERGVGQFKILKHNHKCQYRLLLRREQVFKIACNHNLAPGMELRAMTNSESSVSWNALDFAEGSIISELFAIKFKTKELLEQFKKKFADCVEEISQEKGEVREVEEDEEEEDDGDIMFDKRATLYVLEGQQYKMCGMGSLQIRYDDSIFGAQIEMREDSGELLCSHHIAVQTCLRVQGGTEGLWTALDMEQAARKQFKALFSSEAALKDFQKAFEEGKKLAVESGIIENDYPKIN